MAAKNLLSEHHLSTNSTVSNYQSRKCCDLSTRILHPVACMHASDNALPTSRYSFSKINDNSPTNVSHLLNSQLKSNVIKNNVSMLSSRLLPSKLLPSKLLPPKLLPSKMMIFADQVHTKPLMSFIFFLTGMLLSIYIIHMT